VLIEGYGIAFELFGVPGHGGRLPFFPARLGWISGVHQMGVRSINLKSELAQRLVDVDPTRARNELQEISDLSRKSLAEVRSTVTRMRMPTFEGEVQAARRAFDTTGIQAHLPANVQAVGLYDAAFSWALRELTTNVIRHSGAQNCWVSITQNKLQVVDDGCGFDPKSSTKVAGYTGCTSE
ncbi:sensor histidine kinase, partial [Corynebacterium segmentosum]